MIAAVPRSEAAERGSQPRRLRRPRKADQRRARVAAPRYVGRGTVFANPFLTERFGHARAVGLHRAWLAGRLSWRALRSLGFGDREILALGRLRQRVLSNIRHLRGTDIECWCAETARWCHGDTLIALANGRRI